jgi:hypothetical protein
MPEPQASQPGALFKGRNWRMQQRRCCQRLAEAAHAARLESYNCCWGGCC